MLNACCLAMKDACLPLTSEFSAVSFGFMEDGDLLIDPDLEQEEACQSLFTFVVDGNSGDIATSHASGCFTVKQVKISSHLPLCNGIHPLTLLVLPDTSVYLFSAPLTITSLGTSKLLNLLN